MNPNDPALQFLLASDDPSVRYFALVDLLERPANAREVRAARQAIPDGPRIRALLTGQGAGKRKPGDSLATHAGGFGVHPYKKWDGAHWRLVSLVELGIPANDARAHQAADQVLEWLTGENHRSRIKSINGRTRRCASQEGNALAVCSRLGLTRDPRVRYLAASLVEWQWPDGGWNCDRNPDASHSSFYESLAPFWGLAEYARATGDTACRRAAEHASELFLAHCIFRSDKTGAVISGDWLKLHYPLYWHYDILQSLLILSRWRKLDDARLDPSLDILESKRGADGLWRAEGFYWKRGDKTRSQAEVVDWGRRGPNEMITLNALRVLKAAGRV